MALLKCVRSDRNDDLLHDRISCVFSVQFIKPISCAMLVVTVDSDTSIEELFPLSSLISRKF